MHPAALFPLLLPFTTAAHSKIKLSTVKSLTLHANKPTTGRRAAPVPQMTCQGSGCRHFQPSTMRCTNAGTGYGPEDVQWTCTAELPPAFKLGSTEVQCEGYGHADDPYVLKGSCGVTYRLMLTEQGEAQYGATPWREPSEAEGGAFARYAFIALWVGVAVFIAYNILRRLNEQRQPQPRTRRLGGGGGGGGNGWGGGGGGGPGSGGWGGPGGEGGYDDSADPPPPYSSSQGPTSWSKADPNARTGSGWGWGSRSFWTGAALGGAAAGYMAGRQRDRGARTGWGGGGNGGSAWGGNSDGGGGSRWGGSSSAGASGSGRTYESTGFGGTSRR